MTPSNNLKEQVATELQLEAIIDKYKHRLLNANQLADNTVDLILDTILASEEMQDNNTDVFADYLDQNIRQVRNGLRHELRAMLEGMRNA